MAQRVTLFVTIYQQKPFWFSSVGYSEVNSTWLITSELANQRMRKVLFTCVVYTNNYKYSYYMQIITLISSPSKSITAITGIITMKSNPAVSSLGWFSESLHTCINVICQQNSNNIFYPCHTISTTSSLWVSLTHAC